MSNCARVFRRAVLLEGPLPCAEPAGECPMEPLATALVRHRLLPDRDVGAVVSRIWVERREGRAIECVGRLQGLQVGLEGGAGALGRRHRSGWKMRSGGSGTAPGILSLWRPQEQSQTGTALIFACVRAKDKLSKLMGRRMGSVP